MVHICVGVYMFHEYTTGGQQQQRAAFNMSNVSNEFVNLQHEKKRNDFLSFAWRFVSLCYIQYFPPAIADRHSFSNL